VTRPDSPYPLDVLLAWHEVPGQQLSHARFAVIAHLSTVGICGRDLGPDPDPDLGSHCQDCTLAASTMDSTYLNWPRETTFTNHPLVAAVAARFEAADGRWAALREVPLPRRRVRQEMEAVVRGNYPDPQALLREVLGYLDLAMNASAQDTLRDLAAATRPADPPAAP